MIMKLKWKKECIKKDTQNREVGCWFFFFSKKRTTQLRVNWILNNNPFDFLLVNSFQYFDTYNSSQGLLLCITLLSMRGSRKIFQAGSEGYLSLPGGGGGSKHIFGYFTMVDKFNFWGAWYSSSTNSWQIRGRLGIYTQLTQFNAEA